MFFLRKKFTCWNLCEGKQVPTTTATHLSASVPYALPPVLMDDEFVSVD